MAVSLTMNSLSFYEPMRKNWFIVQFDSSLGTPEGNEGDALTIACKTCDIPSLTTTENVIDRLNDKVYTPGKSEYGTISIVFNEYIQENNANGNSGPGNYNKSAGAILYAWQQKVHNVKSGVQGAKKQIAHNIAIVQIDGAGNATRVWNVYQAWPTQIQFDQLDSGDGTMQTVTATFRFDWAEQKDATLTITQSAGFAAAGTLDVPPIG